MMKTDFIFLTLPVALTVGNLLFATVLLSGGRRSSTKNNNLVVNAQPVLFDTVLPRATKNKCLLSGEDEDCELFDLNTFQQVASAVEEKPQQQAEQQVAEDEDQETADEEYGNDEEYVEEYADEEYDSEAEEEYYEDEEYDSEAEEEYYEDFPSPTANEDPSPSYQEIQQETEEYADEEEVYAEEDFMEDYDEDDDDDEVDPMLEKMPGFNFKAYKRADISSFYQEAPGSRVEQTPTFTGQAAKFVNMSPEPISLYWVNTDGTAHYHGVIGPWAAGGSASFPGHVFRIAKKKDKNAILCEFEVVPNTLVYYCNPFLEHDPNDPAFGKHFAPTRNVKSLDPLDRADYEAHLFNVKFAELYRNFTGGSEWLTMYPRNPPKHKMWRADYFGQTHTITTNETYFLSEPQGNDLPRYLSIDHMRTPPDMSQYRAPGPLNLTIKALSCAPRAFEIRNFLSETEADHILQVVKDREAAGKLTRSQTGSGETSSTRTSRTTWIPRNTDAVLNAVYRRAADVLRLNEALLRQRQQGEEPTFPTLRAINEELQIVHYNVGQEYTAHHDFGYPTGEVDSPSRSINLCLYLNDVPKGGTTSFPRWRNAETGQPIHVKPEKTKAMIFYMVNPDGNLDDLTQHAANPVLEGEKWFANLWIHDPYKL